jgi:hypothetical protein
MATPPHIDKNTLKKFQNFDIFLLSIFYPERTSGYAEGFID